ncbi:MAG: Histidinol-phosphate aminotransferase [Bacteroidetes bacterium ADurb.BinA395]|nr:MAG: Histidinol-phosphate aminotransferase [Bacteroidetes bacterium ADurb.BinA395]
MPYFRSDLQDKKPSKISVPVRKRMMCLNESCLNPYQAIMQAFLTKMDKIELNRYLSSVTDELHSALTSYIGNRLNKENVLWGNGADDILYHIFLAVRETENSYAVSLAPSYFDYQTFSAMVGLKMLFCDLNEDFSFSPEKYLEFAGHPDCRLAILCNPNNPTGNLFSEEQQLQIITALPDKLILVDETYFEFSGKTLADKLLQYPNLMLVRSFSKAFSSAGLRFGYAISSAENIYELSKVLTTFHTSILNQAFALCLLENQDIFKAQVQQTIQLREELFSTLQKIEEIKVYPSATNFLTFSLYERTPEFFNYLLVNDFAVRDVGSHPRLQNCLRVTVSCREDVDAFVSALKQFLE